MAVAEVNPVAAAVSVMVPAVRPGRTQVASWPPFIVMVVGPTIVPGPVRLKVTWRLSVGTTVPLASMMSTKTSRASLRSARMVVPSGRRRSAVAAPGVRRVVVARTVPAIRQSALSVPAANVIAGKVNGGCSGSGDGVVSGERVATTVPLSDSRTWSQLLNTLTLVGDVEVH